MTQPAVDLHGSPVGELADQSPVQVFIKTQFVIDKPAGRGAAPATARQQLWYGKIQAECLVQFFKVAANKLFQENANQQERAHSFRFCLGLYQAFTRAYADTGTEFHRGVPGLLFKPVDLGAEFLHVASLVSAFLIKSAWRAFQAPSYHLGLVNNM